MFLEGKTEPEKVMGSTNSSVSCELLTLISVFSFSAINFFFLLGGGQTKIDYGRLKQDGNDKK